MNDLILSKLKGSVEFQDIIKKDDLNYKSKHYQKFQSIFTTFCFFLRDIHKGHLSIEKANNKQSNFTNERSFDKGTNILGKQSFLNNLGLLLSAREKIFNSFKSKLFPIKIQIKFQYVNQQKQHRSSNRTNTKTSNRSNTC